MRIGNIDLSKEVLVIAEIGNNHEGNFDLARKLVTLAAECGVHAVKFQTIRARHFVSPANEARFKQLQSYELSDKQFQILSDLARDSGLLFLSTPFDLEAVDMLAPLVPAFKIASGDNNFFPLLEKVANTAKPILLSTGLATTSEIRTSKEFIENIWKKTGVVQELALLHCVCAYPAPLEQGNLSAIVSLQQEFGGTIGYSDHTLGPEASFVAAALGARIIEKHFTLNKNHSAFRDHQLSADPDEMKKIVVMVKQIQALLGDGTKKAEDAEKGNLVAARRSIVAKRDLAEGTTLRPDDLSWMRPGAGLSPGKEGLLCNRKLKRAIAQGSPITLEDVV